MPGLPAATIDYLRDLDRDEVDLDWFSQHRDRYEREWLDPAVALIRDLAPALADLDPDLHVEPRVGGSIFRVQRDRRFSPRRPYKPYLDLWAWHGPDRASAPSGLYLRVHPDRLEIAAGVRLLDGASLTTYRDLVLSDAGEPLVAAVTDAVAAGSSLPPADLVRVPTSHPTEDPVKGHLLRRRCCQVVLTAPPPASMGTGRFIGWVVRRWQSQLDVHRWLVGHQVTG